MQQSNFASDLKKEQKLTVLLDAYYQKHLKHYDFERIDDMKRQMQGIDIILKHKTSGKTFFVDEKAQLDYINEELPTFAFELSYKKKGVLKKGWLCNTAKATQFYALVTAIYSDEPNIFTSCKITLVNREKLLDFLKTKNINIDALKDAISKSDSQNGKIKAEKPTNLILKLDFLIENGITKRLV